MCLVAHAYVGLEQKAPREELLQQMFQYGCEFNKKVEDHRKEHSILGPESRRGIYCSKRKT